MASRQTVSAKSTIRVLCYSSVVSKEGRFFLGSTSPVADFFIQKTQGFGSVPAVLETVPLA